MDKLSEQEFRELYEKKQRDIAIAELSLAFLHDTPPGAHYHEGVEYHKLYGKDKSSYIWVTPDLEAWAPRTGPVGQALDRGAGADIFLAPFLEQDRRELKSMLAERQGRKANWDRASNY